MPDVALPVDLVREFVIAGHGNLPKVKDMLANNPSLLNSAYAWSETDHETALQGAAQVGSVGVAEFLLASGAPLDICTAAMLGKHDAVERMLREDPRAVQAKGAHGIPLIAHAALSGNLDLLKMLVQSGAVDGFSMGLSNAVGRGDHKMALWMIENGKPDLDWKDYRGKNVMAIARDQGDREMEELLAKPRAPI